ncbi:hypothetical protein ACFC60_18635 [Kitasatospora purpeofusca]|uniref:hypothetical protein n=1 Tax=Kitasatospora purpeofusca TaxID=67352 RepID=UPI0035DFA30F
MSTNVSRDLPAGRVRSGPTTLGQTAQLLDYEGILARTPELAWTRNLLLRWTAPRPHPLDAVRRAVRLVAERHEVLRSTFHGASGASPAQVVHPYDESVALSVELDPGPAPGDGTGTGTGTGDDVEGGAARRPETRIFAIDQVPPLRFHLRGRDGEVTEIVLVAHHIALDVTAARIVLRELAAALDSGPDAFDSLPAPVQPIEVAREQAARDGTAPLARWDRFVRAVPPTPMPLIGPAGPGRPHLAQYVSPGLGGVLAAVARDHQLLPAQVLLAAFAGAVAERTGVPDVAVGVISANRFSYPAAVHCCALRVPVVVPCEGVEDLRELLGRVRTLTSELAANADHDVRLVRRMQEEEHLRSGHNTLIRIEFNFLSRRPPRTGSRSAVGPGGFSYGPAEASDPCLLYFEARYRGPFAPVALALEAGDSFLPPAAAEELLRSVEHRLGRLAEGKSVRLPAGTGPAGHGGGSPVRYRRGLVDLDRTRDAVRAATGLPVTVALEDTADGAAQELTAYVGRPLDTGWLAAVRGRLAEAARFDPALVVPSRYRSGRPAAGPEPGP